MARLLGEQPKQSQPTPPVLLHGHQGIPAERCNLPSMSWVCSAPPPLGHVGTPHLRVTQEILEESHLNEQAPHLSLLKVRDWPHM